MKQLLKARLLMPALAVLLIALVLGILLSLGLGHLVPGFILAVGVACLFWFGSSHVVRLTRKSRQQRFDAGIIAKEGIEERRREWSAWAAELDKQGVQRYDLPFYMIVGEPSSGKSILLHNSDLNFPFGQQKLSGAGGTRGCDWWFTDEAVILDLAGRLFTHEGGAADAAEWEAFLELLADYRPGCPLNGLILVLPCDSLLSDDREATLRKAGTFQEALLTLTHRLQVQVPVYVVLTKGDKILGFAESVHRLEAEERNKMFGWSRPAEQLGVPFDMQEARLAFRGLVRRAGQLRNQMMATLRLPEGLSEADRMYGFPLELAAIEQNLEIYLKRVFGESQVVQRYDFRGIYLTSGLQTGAPIAKACADLLSTPGEADRRDLKGLFQRQQAYFIRDLIRRRVFSERGLVRATEGRIHRARQRAWLGYGAAASIAFLSLGFATYHVFGKASDEKRVQTDWDNANKAIAKIVGANESNVDTSAQRQYEIKDVDDALSMTSVYLKSRETRGGVIEKFWNDLEEEVKKLEVALIERRVLPWIQDDLQKKYLARRKMDFVDHTSSDSRGQEFFLACVMLGDRPGTSSKEASKYRLDAIHKALDALEGPPVKWIELEKWRAKVKAVARDPQQFPEIRGASFQRPDPKDWDLLLQPGSPFFFAGEPGKVLAQLRLKMLLDETQEGSWRPSDEDLLAWAKDFERCFRIARGNTPVGSGSGDSNDKYKFYWNLNEVKNVSGSLEKLADSWSNANPAQSGKQESDGQSSWLLLQKFRDALKNLHLESENKTYLEVDKDLVYWCSSNLEQIVRIINQAPADNQEIQEFNDLIDRVDRLAVNVQFSSPQEANSSSQKAKQWIAWALNFKDPVTVEELSRKILDDWKNACDSQGTEGVNLSNPPASRKLYALALLGRALSKVTPNFRGTGNPDFSQPSTAIANKLRAAAEHARSTDGVNSLARRFDFPTLQAFLILDQFDTLSTSTEAAPGEQPFWLILLGRYFSELAANVGTDRVLWRGVGGLQVVLGDSQFRDSICSRADLSVKFKNQISEVTRALEDKLRSLPSGRDTHGSFESFLRNYQDEIQPRPATFPRITFESTDAQEFPVEMARLLRLLFLDQKCGDPNSVTSKFSELKKPFEAPQSGGENSAIASRDALVAYIKRQNESKNSDIRSLDGWWESIVERDFMERALVKHREEFFENLKSKGAKAGDALVKTISRKIGTNGTVAELEGEKGDLQDFFKAGGVFDQQCNNYWIGLGFEYLGEDLDKISLPDSKELQFYQFVKGLQNFFIPSSDKPWTTMISFKPDPDSDRKDLWGGNYDLFLWTFRPASMKQDTHSGPHAITSDFKGKFLDPKEWKFFSDDQDSVMVELNLSWSNGKLESNSQSDFISFNVPGSLAPLRVAWQLGEPWEAESVGVERVGPGTPLWRIDFDASAFPLKDSSGNSGHRPDAKASFLLQFSSPLPQIPSTDLGVQWIRDLQNVRQPKIQ